MNIHIKSAKKAHEPSDTLQLISLTQQVKISSFSHTLDKTFLLSIKKAHLFLFCFFLMASQIEFQAGSFTGGHTPGAVTALACRLHFQGGAALDQPMEQLRAKQSPSRSRYARNYAGLVIQGHNLMIFFAFVFTRFRCQKQNRTLSYLI